MAKDLQSYVNKISNSPYFINATTIIIVFYSLVLGVRTYENVVIPLYDLFIILDYTVTIYFLIEIIIRMLGEKEFKNFFKDGWNIFDFLVVLITIIPFEQSDFAMIARLARVFKVMRLITVRPELKMIIDVLVKSIPAIVDIIILLFIIFYIYAIIGSFLFQDLESGLWKNFLTAMLTLFRVLTFEDWTDVMYEAMEKYEMSWLFFVSFIIIAAFVFFNLFIAVIINEMEKHSNKDQNQAEQDKLDLILSKIDKIEKEIKNNKKEL
jgi:voltage-gated sodium channel